jgi:hypothetical protein
MASKPKKKKSATVQPDSSNPKGFSITVLRLVLESLFTALLKLLLAWLLL